MTWNYRITKQRCHYKIGGKKRRETVFAIREVYYDKKGKGNSWTMNACAIDGLGSKAEVIETLEMMLKDAKQAPVLVIEDAHRPGPCGYCGRGFEEGKE